MRSPPATARAATTMAVAGGSWTALGPRPIKGLDSFGDTSGRVTSLALDPTDSNTVYAGTAGGGVWKTANGGLTWAPLTDAQATLAIGAVAVDPKNHLTVYAATGEGDRCGDCGLSQGVLKSTDGGASWTLQGQSTFGVGLTKASSIAVDRTTSQSVLVGTTTGLYQSTDGGQSWSLNPSLTGPNSTTPPSVDVIRQDPDVATRFWAAVGEHCQGSGYIAVSTDSGMTWAINKRMSDFAGFPRIDRIGLDVAPGGMLYAAASTCADAQGQHWGRLAGILKSTSAGASWTVINTSSLADYMTFPGAPATADGQGPYDDVVAIDPTSPTHVVFGGVTMVKTTDGGATFTDIARPYTGGPVHPDFHAVAFTGSNALYTASDGGVWKTSNLGGTGLSADWVNLNASLAISTFYSGTALDLTHMIGGAQDEGTSGLLPGGPAAPGWRTLLRSDGTWTAMDPTPGSTVIYGEHPFGFIYKGSSTNTVIDPNQLNSGWTLAGPCAVKTDPACAEPADFSAPFVLDRTVPSRLYAATNRVYRSTTSGLPAGVGGWTPISGDLTTGTSIYANGDWITAMAIDAPDTIVTGSFFGRVMITTNATAATPTWTDMSGGLPALPQFDPTRYIGEPWITTVAVAHGEVWVGLGILGGGRVWERIYVPSLQYPWTDLTGTGNTALPNHIVTSIAADPTSWQYTTTLYVGTDAGTYICGFCGYANLMPSWQPLGSNLPNARIDRINLTSGNGQIVGWSHGRGAYWLSHETALAPSSNSLFFGSKTVSEATSLPLTLTGTGTTSSTNLTFNVTGPNAADFTTSSDPGTCPGQALVPGQSCGVSIIFRPSGGGSESATMTVTDAQGGSSAPIQLQGTGVLAAASLPATVSFAYTGVGVYSGQTVTVTNSGSVNLDLASVTVTGPNASEFDAWQATSCLVDGGVRPIAPGHACSFTVFFSPSDAGLRTATLNLTDNATGSPQTIGLSGTGVLPNVGLSPGVLDFGYTDIAAGSDLMYVTVTNNGPSAFTGVPVVAGTNAGDFTAYPDQAHPCGAINLGSTCLYYIIFRPHGLGSRTATLTMRRNTSTTNTSVTLTGIGAAEQAALTPNPVNFGLENVGTTSIPLTVTFTNTGQVKIFDAFPGLSGPDASDFSVPSGCSGETPSMGTLYVAPGASCTIAVTFTPSAKGIRQATLFVGSAFNQWSAPLVGEGVHFLVRSSVPQALGGGFVHGRGPATHGPATTPASAVPSAGAPTASLDGHREELGRSPAAQSQTITPSWQHLIQMLLRMVRQLGW